MGRKTLQFIRDNPIPPFALIGLLSGGVFQFAFNRPDIANIVWVAALIIGGAPVVWETLRRMLKGNFASDVVAMLAIITAVLTGEYFAGVIIVLMQSGGEALENYSLRRASSSLEQLLTRAPRFAHRRINDRIEEIDVEKVQIGDDLIVRPGDLIPVDGEVMSEQAEVDESALTGEPLARSKHKGDTLLSGSVNTGDVFDMKATKLAEQSQYAQIVQLVRKAQDDKSPLQRLADRYAVYFTPATLIMCVLGFLITKDIKAVLSVLVVATPCPLILATPVAVIGGINRAAKAGLIVKGGVAIEQLGQAKAMVFDKTGTLTYGTPVVDQVVPYDGVAAPELLQIAGSVEQLSSHLLAQTMARAAQQASGALATPTDFHEQAGHGVEANLGGTHIVIGSPRYLNERTGGVALPAQTSDTELSTYVAIDNKPSGYITFKDELRPGVADLMKKLRKMGIERTVMLTGDSQAHAASIAAQAGIDEVKADLLPEDKLNAIKSLKQQYQSVVMVGDGINDAPALATATVGIAMGAHGTGISAEAADIVLLVDDITHIADGVEASQRTVRIAKQSIFVGLGLSFGLMVLAAFGLIPPAIGALFQEAIDVAVILNALRAR
ncbi:MAG: heavy metal translocating P-type ATPase [Aggregatilineales bacterium]